jgi:hypothetical protein
MARYDWPAGPYSHDDPGARAAHLVQIRPRADLTVLEEAAPRGVGQRESALPTGSQHLWFPIGPSVMVNGQATGNPNVAGRIRDLQVEPTQGLRVYAASASGGVWYSADRGVSWRPLDDWLETPDHATAGTVANALACGAIQVVWGAALDGSQDEVWVGTGELGGGAGGQPGGQVGGVGFLHAIGPATKPVMGDGGWEIVKGEPLAGPGSADDTLRGHSVYRIAGDPGDKQQLVAGTTHGLYVHSTAVPPASPWSRALGWDPAGPDARDVVLTRTGGMVRIWVAALSALWVAESTSPINPTALVFKPVTLPNVVTAPRRMRMVIAATADGTTLYVLGRRTVLPADKTTLPPAELWRVDATATLAALSGTPGKATQLPGLPKDLFGTDNDQGWYDMCLAIHPTVTNRVYVGGSTVSTAGGYNAALYRCETTDSATATTLIGDGVHADQHQLRIWPPPGPANPPQVTVWVCCDGGLFRSDADGDPKSFKAYNDGLAVLEPGYVASHPTNPGIVTAGFQDNGTAVRVGDTVWEQKFVGDGGGVVYDPAAVNRFFRQYSKADWRSSDHRSVQPVLRRHARQKATLKTSEALERDASRFYSGMDAVAHGGDTHLAVGSDRVWYSRDWGRTWITLPTGTDPRGTDNVNMSQDVMDPADPQSTIYSDTTGSTDCCSSTTYGEVAIGTGILSVKFAKPADTNDGKHMLRVLSLYESRLVLMSGTRPASDTGPFTWDKTTKTLEFREHRDDAEKGDFLAGKPLKFLPARGLVSDAAVHNADRGPLGSFYVSTTGQRPNDEAAIGERRETLWFFDGTDTWIPCGLRTTSLVSSWDDPAKRVTAPALAVVVDPVDRSIVYVGTSVGVVKGTLTIGGTEISPTYAWVWEQFMNGLPEAAVQDLSIFQFGNLKLLRAALQARGIWETDLANATSSTLTYLRVHPSDTRWILPTPLTGPAAAGEESLRWDDSPDIVVAIGSAGAEPPTEAQLRKVPLAGGPGTRGRVLITERHPVVHVLVHQRWSHPTAPDNVRVALIRHDIPPTGDVPLGGLWPVLVDAATSGNAPPSLPDGWSRATPVLWKNPQGPVDSRTPRTVSFDLDLSADLVGSVFALVAVVMVGTNPIGLADLAIDASTNATTANKLVLTSRHVAAKSIEIGL